MKNKAYKGFMNAFNSKSNKKEGNILDNSMYVEERNMQDDFLKINENTVSLEDEIITEEKKSEATSIELGIPTVIQKEESVVETTIIGKTMKVNGNIECFGDIKIFGEIYGSVNTTKDMFIEGTCIGNLSCCNFFSDKANIEGNIKSDNQIHVKEYTKIKGNLNGNVIIIEGQVYGDVVGLESISLGEKSIIHGDVSAKYISIKKGAKLNGNIFMNNE